MTAALFAAMGIALLGGVISGSAGFGFALVVVPPLLLIYPPATVTAVALSLTLATGWIVLAGAWRRIQWRTVLGLLPGATIGVFVGALLIRELDAAYIKLIAGVVVACFALSLIRDWKLAGTGSPFAPPIAGFSSGTLNTSTGMAGPPVALLFATRKYDMHEFRASIMAYFYVVDLLGMAVLIHQDVVGRTQLEDVAKLLPAAIVGGFIGRRLVNRFSEDGFRRVTLAMLLITGVFGIVAALTDLL